MFDGFVKIFIRIEPQMEKYWKKSVQSNGLPGPTSEAANISHELVPNVPFSFFYHSNL